MNSTLRQLTVAGMGVSVAETGQGTPLVYLHGYADIHAASDGWLPFQQQLSRSHRLLAPAFPACAESAEDEEIETIDDVAYRWIEVIDALGLARFDLIGNCFGGWVAAELAVRHPERVNRLALIGASGLFLPGEPIADLFMEVQARNGRDFSGLRHLMFAHADDAAALALLPDGRVDLAREISRYKVMRFCSRVGFSPPYFYNRKLINRLSRYRGPALVISGAEDHMVPIAHARAYANGLPGARLEILSGCGHSPGIERCEQTVALLDAFFQ
jgi:pimeloyl-ACP methyl ester carboxylesterase